MELSYQENTAKKFSFEFIGQFQCSDGQLLLIDQKQLDTLAKIRCDKGRWLYAESIYANQNPDNWFNEINRSGKDIRRFQSYLESLLAA